MAQPQRRDQPGDHDQNRRPLPGMTFPLRTPPITLAQLLFYQDQLQTFYRELRPGDFYDLPPHDRLLTWTRAIQHETAELERELPWKPWRNGPDLDENRERRLGETVDILFFWLNACLDQGFTCEELQEAYLAKWRENQRRQREDPEFMPPEHRKAGGGEGLG